MEKELVLIEAARHFSGADCVKIASSVKKYISSSHYEDTFLRKVISANKDGMFLDFYTENELEEISSYLGDEDKQILEEYLSVKDDREERVQCQIEEALMGNKFLSSEDLMFLLRNTELFSLEKIFLICNVYYESGELSHLRHLGLTDEILTLFLSVKFKDEGFIHNHFIIKFSDNHVIKNALPDFYHDFVDISFSLLSQREYLNDDTQIINRVAFEQEYRSSLIAHILPSLPYVMHAIENYYMHGEKHFSNKTVSHLDLMHTLFYDGEDVLDFDFISHTSNDREIECIISLLDFLGLPSYRDTILKNIDEETSLKVISFVDSMNEHCLDKINYETLVNLNTFKVQLELMRNKPADFSKVQFKKESLSAALSFCLRDKEIAKELLRNLKDVYNLQFLGDLSTKENKKALLDFLEGFYFDDICHLFIHYFKNDIIRIAKMIDFLFLGRKEKIKICRLLLNTLKKEV